MKYAVLNVNLPDCYQLFLSAAYLYKYPHTLIATFIFYVV